MYANQILLLDEDMWSQLYSALASSLVVRFGLLSYYHDRFRQAVVYKYLSRENSVKVATRKLAAYFKQKLQENNITYRVVDELPYLLERAGDREELKSVITNIKLFDKVEFSFLFFFFF